VSEYANNPSGTYTIFSKMGSFIPISYMASTIASPRYVQPSDMPGRPIVPLQGVQGETGKLN
jgi:hypothetical protein